jgi:hypothetical protein
VDPCSGGQILGDVPAERLGAASSPVRYRRADPYLLEAVGDENGTPVPGSAVADPADVRPIIIITAGLTLTDLRGCELNESVDLFHRYSKKKIPLVGIPAGLVYHLYLSPAKTP